jgi:hypothetical protein
LHCFQPIVDLSSSSNESDSDAESSSSSSSESSSGSESEPERTRRSVGRKAISSDEEDGGGGGEDGALSKDAASDAEENPLEGDGEDHAPLKVTAEGSGGKMQLPAKNPMQVEAERAVRELLAHVGYDELEKPFPLPPTSPTERISPGGVVVGLSYYPHEKEPENEPPPEESSSQAEETFAQPEEPSAPPKEPEPIAGTSRGSAKKKEKKARKAKDSSSKRLVIMVRANT